METANDNGVFFDHKRGSRLGLPEAIFCAGKSREALCGIIEEFGNKSLFFTRLTQEMHDSLPEELQARLHYHPLSQSAYTGLLQKRPFGSVAIVSAGTSDAPVVWETAKTLDFLGIRNALFEDCGVAGLWRITSRIAEINTHSVVIVVAGLDAALASVLGGLTPRPLIAVPAPTGYGIAKQGETALCAMLASCAPGVCVMNIGNGYGAACAAVRIINLLESSPRE